MDLKSPARGRLWVTSTSSKIAKKNVVGHIYLDDDFFPMLI